jgi:outer membrane protein with beta-barrel domain
MRYLTRSTAIVVALLALGASLASAQHAQTRKGFWIGFGFGWGSYGISDCSGCGRSGSVSGYLKMGGVISPHLLLGGETNGWTKSESGDRITAANASFAAYYYPQPAGGFFLRGGVGFSTAEVSSGGSSASKTGPGVTLGAGYDLRVGANTSIVPVANFVWGHPTSGFSQNFLQLAVGVTFH